VRGRRDQEAPDLFDECRYRHRSFVRRAKAFVLVQEGESMEGNPTSGRSRCIPGAKVSYGFGAQQSGRYISSDTGVLPGYSLPHHEPHWDIRRSLHLEDRRAYLFPCPYGVSKDSDLVAILPEVGRGETRQGQGRGRPQVFHQRRPRSARLGVEWPRNPKRFVGNPIKCDPMADVVNEQVSKPPSRSQKSKVSEKTRP
jgi:hypothetical protein